jgi:hypothetical protein
LVIKILDSDPYPDQDSMIRIHSSAQNLSKNTGSDVGFPHVQRMERLRLESEKTGEEDDEYECHVCSANLYLSLVGSRLPFLPFFYMA